MANPNRGVVEIDIEERSYKLSFSVNALCELEDKLDRPVPEIAASLEDPARVRMSTVRALVWAGLRDHHEDTTIEQAGDLVTAAGIPAVMEAIGRAFALAFPEAKEAKNPRVAKGSAR